MKRCTKCGMEKDFASFHKNKSRCKDCVKIYNQSYHTVYYQENKNEILESALAYYQENKEKKLEYQNQYRQENEEQVKESKKKWNQSENKKEYDRKYYQENKDKIIEYQQENHEIIKKQRAQNKKRRRAADPAFKLRNDVSVSINKMLKSQSSSKKNYSFLQCVSWTPDELKQYLEKQFESWMNWENRGGYDPKTWDDNDLTTWTWQLDHIIPQSDLSYSSMEDENFKKCWALENLRPYPSKYNLLDGITRVRHKKDSK